ncbi:ABC transporter permease [Planosporangium thailandense]|uniref:ABC transporter permease n=1 Tax=Planosporangium thailandense TaxID=765197 RepID=A0ABX0XWI0_9ACTN|nr:FtsX-like permease family protein [Planosporangium thailandense]NJC69730.1 ABC transporter permease [Planosporangium thailandense]
MIARWIRDLILGARLSRAGGRDGRVRMAMTAVGVGIGVAMLLAASSIPAMLQARHDRTAARDYQMYGDTPMAKSDRTLLVTEADTEFRGITVRGRLLQPDGPHAPVPPGLATLPRPGEMVVSPALAALLSAPDGALLRPRLPDRIVGSIGDRGLAGPREYAFYLGSDQLTADSNAHRIDHFGDRNVGDAFSPMLALLIVIIFVVLLLPIGMFIAAAIRFGDERRDRRLAALRLVGADSRMVRRIAAGEALVAAGLGLLAGALFFLVGIQFVEGVTLTDISVFTSDVRPDAVFATLVALAVPAAAVGITVLAMSRAVIEPLGVVRRSGGTRRRLWWRLAPPAVGLALLYPLVGQVGRSTARANPFQVAGGAVLLLISVAVILPWLIEAVVRRLGGGGVAWQLAVRRLQLSSGTAARIVNGVAVAVAGGIALQMLFSAAAASNSIPTGQDITRAQVEAGFDRATGPAIAAEAGARFRATPGVRSVLSFAELTGTDPKAPAPSEGMAPTFPIYVADCRTLAELAAIDRCADGDAFLVARAAGDPFKGATPGPGERVRVGSVEWTVPPSARPAEPKPDSLARTASGVYATPSAAGVAALREPSVRTFLRVDQAKPDVYEYVRNTAFAIDPAMYVTVLQGTRASSQFITIQRGLFIGLVVTLLMIGASLLVSTLEQLQERRRLLAALVAVGAQRATLGWSVLWQTAVPVLLGLGLAVVAGAGLGAVLLAMVGEPVRFDWWNVSGIAGTAAAVVLVVTGLSLPVLWRLVRPDGLRTE